MLFKLISFFVILVSIVILIVLITLTAIVGFIMLIVKTKNINEDEIYSENMNISTFDGSNEFTHPSVLYFEKGFNGYKYWMAYTPYHNCNVNIENPCIAVSNDGINFIKLLKNIKQKQTNIYVISVEIIFPNTVPLYSFP